MAAQNGKMMKDMLGEAFAELGTEIQLKDAQDYVRDRYRANGPSKNYFRRQQALARLELPPPSLQTRPRPQKERGVLQTVRSLRALLEEVGGREALIELVREL